MTHDRPRPTPFAGSPAGARAVTGWLLAAALAIATTALGLNVAAGSASAVHPVPAGVGTHLSTSLDAVTFGAASSSPNNAHMPRPTLTTGAEIVGISAALLALSLGVAISDRRQVVAGVTLPSRRAPPRRRSSR